MSYPGKRSFPHTGGYQFGVVVGQGGANDEIKDQKELGLIQVKSLTDHGEDVKVSDLALVSTRGDLQSWGARPPLPGSPVYIESQHGSNSVRIARIARNTTNNPTESIPGNENLFTASQDAMEAWNRKLNLRPLPDVKEVEKRGAIIREVVEKSQDFSTSLLKGLPTNGSIFSLIEQKLPSKKEIETAKEHFNNILNSSIMSKLPGSNMSIGKMFGKLTDKEKEKIAENMPSDCVAALESLMYLMPEVTPHSGSLNDMRVNEEVFMRNAIDLLSQVRSVSDLTHVLTRLMSDTDLFGLDELEDILLEIETPFGNVIRTINATGELSMVTCNTNNNTISSAESFGSFMQSSSASDGAAAASPLDNLFDQSAKTMFDMFNRASPEAFKSGVELMKNTNSTSQAVKRNNIMRVFSEGGNLIEEFFKNLDG